MANLFFTYSSMGAGKSSDLLQAQYNYEERKMRVDTYKPSIDTREDKDVIRSRIGLEAPTRIISPEESFVEIYNANRNSLPDCIMVDEAQFLTVKQVEELRDLVDYWEIPVMCYGLRTDFQRNLFPGSAALLALADKLTEKKTICHCGKAARFVLRTDDLGGVIKSGEQVVVGGNNRYVSVCSFHWQEGVV